MVLTREVEIAQPIARQKNAMPKKRILIVEDSFIVAFHLQSTLENEGYNVVAKCDSGEDAVKAAVIHKPDVVLMDIMLNGEMDGIQAASIIKEQLNLPVIYITALSDKETIGRAKITEPYGYLTKPFEDREIFTVIEMALYKHEIESKLKRSEEKYFSTINSISDAVITIDRDYCVTYMNPSAIAITQWASTYFVGKPVTEVICLRDNRTGEVGINPIACSIDSKHLNRLPEDLTLIGKHGLELPIGESSLSPLLDSHESFIGLIIIFKDMTDKKEHELLKREFERHKMSAFIEGEEKERARVAKDLHDSLGQMLNAIKMNATVQQSKIDGEDLSSLIDEAIQESVRISENLLPAKLKDFDLATCLRSFSQQVKTLTHSQISFTYHGVDFQMEQSQKVNFYRIVQEAVNNSIKHAQAQNITIQLNDGCDFMRLSIEDDGIGISSARPSTNGHHGLVNMRDRAEIMGGKLIIESDARRGTMIIVEVPTNKLIPNEQA